MVSIKPPDGITKPAVKQKNPKKKQATINFGGNSSMIGPSVLVAKNMRDFEKDENLFDFANTKSRK